MNRYQRLLPYGVAISSTLTALLLSLWLEVIITRTIGAFFYIAIAISTWYGGMGPGILAIFLSSLALNYYFIPPIYQIQISSFNDVLRLGLFVIVSLIITLLSTNLQKSRQQVEQLSRQLIEENTDRLNVALSAAQMGMWDWDMITGEIRWSPEHAQLFGLAPGEFDGKYETFDARLHPDDRENLNQAIAHALKHERPYHHEYRVIWPDGSIHWIEGRGHAFYRETGQPVRMSGTVMAIDERKQAEAALQEREALLRLFAQYVPAGIAMFDQDMRYVMASQRWVDEYNLDSIESLIHRSHYEIFPEIPAEWRQIHQRCLAGAIEKCEEDLFIRANGKQQWLFWEIHPWHIATGEIGGIIIFTVDITKRKQTALALQELNVELEQRVTDRTEELTALNDRLLQSLLELQQSKQDIEDLYNRAPCGYHSLDSNGIFVRINDTALEWLGYRRDQVLGTIKFVDLLTPNTKDIFYQNFPQFKQQGSINNLEFQLLNQDGSTRWVSLNATAIKDQQGRFIMSRSTLFDISDRKQAEIALQQQTRQKQLLWNITQNLRQSLDLNAILNTAVEDVRQTLQVDRVAVYRFQPDWSGDFIAESARDDWVKLINPDVKKIWQDTYLQETAGGRFQHQETYVISDIYQAGLQPCHIELLEQFQAKAYAVAPIFSGDTLWGLLAIYQNATARDWQPWEIELLKQIASQLSIALQQAELYSQLQNELQERQQAASVLREAERRWRSLLENVQLIVVGLDQLGHVNYVNPFFLSLTGYSASEVLGNNWFENFLPPTNQESRPVVFSELLAYNPDPHHQNSILTKSGEERIIAWNNTILQDAHGTIIGTISIGEDITERQKVEAIKDEFIGIVSHELRTPLTAIQMSLGLLKTGIYAKKPEKSQRMIEIALIDTNRLVNLVNDILDLERLESGRAILEKTVCPAADLMQQAVDGMQAIATQHRITLTIIPTDETVWAAADPIIQTLTNLLSNAIKFSPTDSVIHLRADRQADNVLFQISDQGRGIPADKLETIFGRFQQVDVSDSREKGGTGLGLPICRSIIERHGGKIWAESTLGTGSTFCFTLPISSLNSSHDR